MSSDDDLETLQTFLEFVGKYTYYSPYTYSLKEVIDKPKLLYLLSNDDDDDIDRFCRKNTIINDSQVIEIEGIELTCTK